MFYSFLRWVFPGPFLHLFYRPKAQGLEHVPQTGPAILASNHLSFSDSLFMPLMVRGRPVTFLAKSEYFTGKGIKGKLIAAVMRSAGQVPVDRAGGKSSEQALLTGLSVLRDGELLGIYPEGTRSHDGRLYRGRTGIARLALESGAPVIPVAMIGTEHVQPPGKVIPRLGHVSMVFGPPLDFSRYRGLESDRYVLRAVTDEIMYALMAMGGQEYVDIYATTAKRRAAG